MILNNFLPKISSKHFIPLNKFLDTPLKYRPNRMMSVIPLVAQPRTVVTLDMGVHFSPPIGIPSPGNILKFYNTAVAHMPKLFSPLPFQTTSLKQSSYQIIPSTVNTNSSSTSAPTPAFPSNSLHHNLYLLPAAPINLVLSPFHLVSTCSAYTSSLFASTHQLSQCSDRLRL